MAMLTLKINVVDCCVTKTMNFDPSTIVYDACRMIRDKVPETGSGLHANASDYGLFYTEENKKTGIWLEPARSLDYYVLRNGDLLEYKKKSRVLKVKMLDESVKTLFVDDSHTVSHIMITICSKIGITNHEEYSLVRELSEEEKEKTMTMKRDKSIARNQKKMDEMKKKLHTDDELDWLDHSKSLREQGIEEAETLLLRRKYFFSDQNIDSRDPIQLNLLYVQTRDAILKGTHPVSQDMAVEFAALQCQIQFGDYVESKHKPGFLDLKEFLPKECCRVKGIEKKIFQEQKKHAGLSEIDGKAKYTQLARSLPTYGIAFFLVKEKMKGRNKLVPTLLGITKESVVKIDEKKEIVKTWPLTTVKRWAASPNTFTLDFGDYADSYYCVQTLEGEPIAQLISGYIDIILKKKQAKDHLGVDGDEESTMYEDSVSPAKATIIQHQSAGIGQASLGNIALPAVLRSGEMNNGALGNGMMQQTQFSKVSQMSHLGHKLPSGQNAGTVGMSNGQRALLGRINDSLQSLSGARSDLQSKADLPNLGSDLSSRKWRESTKDLSKQRVGAELSAMNAATAQMVLLTSSHPDDTDYAAVGSAVQTISSNMGDFAKDMRLLAALEEDEKEGENLMDAARRLIGAFNDMLIAAQPGSSELHKHSLLPRQNMLNAASRVGEASQVVMNRVESEFDNDLKERLMASARAVATATAALVMQAKNVSGQCQSKEDQNAIIETATKCALASSQLVSCTRVLASTVDNAQCQDQLVDAAKTVAKSIGDVVDISEQVCQHVPTLNGLNLAAAVVTKTLEELMGQVKNSSQHNEGLDQVDTIMITTDRLCNSVDNTQELVKQARQLAQATSYLVNSLKTEADSQSDSDKQNRLLSAAKLLADATARMVEAAKGCASSPHDEANQKMLKNAADELRSATSQAAANALKQPILHNLQQAAKNAATAATQLISTAVTAGHFNSSQQSQQQLSGQCSNVAEDAIPKMVQALRNVQKQPDSPSSFRQLVNASQDFIHPCNKLLSATKAALPTITDEPCALSLNNASKNLTSALTELRSATDRAHQTCTITPETEVALDQIKALEQELQETKKSALQGMLVPLPGETIELSTSQLGAASKAVATAMAQLLTAATQGNQDYTGSSASEVAKSLKNLATAVRGVAATTKDEELEANIIDQGIDVLQKSGRLVEQAKKVMENPEDVDAKTRLAMATKVVSQSLSSCVNCLPGMKAVDLASKRVTDIGSKLSQLPQSPYRGTERSVAEVQLRITENAADFNKTARDMVEICQGSDKNIALITAASQKLSKVYEDFVEGAVSMAQHSKDPESQNQILGGLRNVSLATNRFLSATKSMLTDPTGPSTKNLLTQAARAVTDSINQLINVCTVSAPGQKECDSAHRQMQMLKPLLDNPSQPIVEGTFFDCMDNVMDESKGLAESMTSVTSLARQSDMLGFCNSVENFSKHVCEMIENAAQAAYLVGISDPSSEPGKVGIINQDQFVRASETIHSSCSILGNPSTTQSEMLAAVSNIANQTSALCNACRTASSKTTNPVAKRQFVQSAKDLANNTALMVKSMKAATTGQQQGPPINMVGHEASKPLLQSLEELANFALVPEFINTPAKISQQGREAQRPIVEAGRDIIEGACQMVLTAKQLAVKPKDMSTYQAYSGHSHTLSEAIKKLVSSLRNALPGTKECDTSLDQIGHMIHDLDQASLAVVSSDPAVATLGDGRSLEMCHDQVLNSAWQLHDLIEPLQLAAKGETGNLGHLVSSANVYIGPLKSGTVGCVSKIVNSKVQTSLIDQCKTVMESLQGLIHAAKEAGGNRKATKFHGEVDEAAAGAKESMKEFIETFEKTASSSGVMSALLENLNKSLALTDEEVKNSPEESSFVDHQTNIARIVKQLAKTSNEMMTKSVTNAQDLGPLANDLTRDFGDLSIEGQKAFISCPNPQMAIRIKSSIQQLGRSCIGLVQNAGKVQLSPSDSFAKKDLAEDSKKVVENATNILTILQSSARGTQACINAGSTINGIIADLDTTIMFASAGTLTAEPGETFSNYREGILKTAKELVEDTKLLVSGAALNQDQLAGAASKSVATINQLSECIKRGAASLGSDQPEAQILLMNAVKDVATALSDLIGATKSAAGKQANDPTMATLKDAAKVMVTNVTSLLKTVKTVEDEAARGSQALESSIQIIGQELKTYSSSDRVEKMVTPDEIIQVTRRITMATSKAVAAGNSGHQDDIISAANVGRMATSDLLKHCKGGVVVVEDKQLKQRMLDAGAACASAYRDLLLNIQQITQKPTPESKSNLAVISKKVATSVTEIVHAAEAIKGVDWVDPHDPTVIAETELLSAANSIEAAAKKLASLQPMLKPKQADETLNFEEQLLEAAKSIATATCALVKAASVAQRELVYQGKIGVKDDLDSDSQWSQGLISAARLVAAATHSLCDAANAMVQGQASEEKLISSAKQVAASTAQLLLACKVKADPNSQAMHRLQNAGHAVKKATEALVREAQKVKGSVEEDTSVPVTKKMVSDMAQIIMAQEEILRKEKELEIARKKLESIRKAKYRPSEDD